MSRFEIQVATILTLLIASGSIRAQVPSGQCDQTTASCALPSQPTLTVALPASSRESPQLVTVTYDGKLLSVRAHGASLRNVLNLIGNRTGTELDLGVGWNSGGAYVDLGPATVHDLLRDLLNGSQLNYVMFRSSSDPGFVERLVILGGAQGPAGVDRQPATVVATGQPAPPKLYGAGFAEASEEGDSAPSVPAPAEQQPVAAAAQPVAVQPSAVQTPVDPSISKYQEQYQQAMKDAASTGRSRADIIEELQKLQQKELDDQYAAQPH